MQGRLEALAANLRERFSAMECAVEEACGEVNLQVPAEKLLEVAEALRDEPDFAFEELIDVCGVDYSAYGQSEWQTSGAQDTGFGRGVDRSGQPDQEMENRFASVYHLLSVANNHRLRVRVFLDTAQPIVDSVVEIWSAANWFEREAFDLYGILYNGHPDLRRILTDYGFIGHPFRKDFPLIGHVEMRYDTEQGRVIYEPVASVEPRTLVPKVVREDNRYLGEDNAPMDSSDA
jgi:NADH-quinone oxidoreductase subunit C